MFTPIGILFALASSRRSISARFQSAGFLLLTLTIGKRMTNPWSGPASGPSSRGQLSDLG